jgi:glucan endo-1,3-alpha-glucosidase
MDHTALLDINAYYATAFKTSQFPPINKDRIWLSARPHTNQAYVPNEVAGRPTGGQL